MIDFDGFVRHSIHDNHENYDNKDDFFTIFDPLKTQHQNTQYEKALNTNCFRFHQHSTFCTSSTKNKLSDDD